MQHIGQEIWLYISRLLFVLYLTRGQRIMNKLEFKDITEESLLKWIKNYLQGMGQKIYLRGSFSKWLKTRSGLPQGSAFGPILILMYMHMNHTKTCLQMMTKS